MSTFKDDDLLILPEDATSLDFSVPEELSSEKKDNSQEENFDFVFEDKDSNEAVVNQAETKDSLSDLANSIVSDKQEKLKEEKFDLGEFMIDKVDETSENLASSSVSDNYLDSDSSEKNKNLGDMSEILSRTIAEFNQRENLIEKDISQKEEHISLLEKELSTEKALVSGLVSEKSALEKNRQSLEKMKSDFEKTVA
ncbi:hypothetical protein DLH72_02935 [Candidatus Gracilibacteria bacterium]|nr:MAG: hypothetical protein DLH72_02935 [Candidatus Gracilibacteria bacterium]